MIQQRSNYNLPIYSIYGWLFKSILIAPEDIQPTVCELLTAIQGMNDAGYKIRHIICISGHKNGASVKSYKEIVPPSIRKKNMSDTLTQPAVSTYTSGSKAQVQGPYVDPLLFCVPMFASSSNPGVLLQSSNIFQQDSTFNSCVFNFEKYL